MQLTCLLVLYPSTLFNLHINSNYILFQMSCQLIFNYPCKLEFIGEFVCVKDAQAATAPTFEKVGQNNHLSF